MEEFNKIEDNEKVSKIKVNILITLWLISIVTIYTGWVIFTFITSPVPEDYGAQFICSIFLFTFFSIFFSGLIYLQIYKKVRKITSIPVWDNELARLAAYTGFAPFFGFSFIAVAIQNSNGSAQYFIASIFTALFFSAPVVGGLAIVYLSIKALILANEYNKYKNILIYIKIDILLFLIMAFIFGLHPYFPKVITGPINFIGWVSIGIFTLICSILVMKNINLPVSILPLNKKSTIIHAGFVTLSLLSLLLFYVLLSYPQFRSAYVGCSISGFIILINCVYIIILKTRPTPPSTPARFRKYYPVLVIIIFIIALFLIGNVYSTMSTSKLIIKDADGDDNDGHLTGYIEVVNLGGQPVEGNIEVRMFINNSSQVLGRKKIMEGFDTWTVDVDINENYTSMVYLYVDENLVDKRDMDICYDVIVVTIICSVSLLFLPGISRRKKIS